VSQADIALLLDLTHRRVSQLFARVHFPEPATRIGEITEPAWPHAYACDRLFDADPSIHHVRKLQRLPGLALAHSTSPPDLRRQCYFGWGVPFQAALSLNPSIA
jgi:hypothetical protein